MRAAELLLDLGRLGIRLEADGERLRYFPRSALTPDLLDRLKAHKADVLALLRAAPEATPIEPNNAAAVWQAALDRLDGDPWFPPELWAAMRTADARCGRTEPQRLTAQPAKPASDWPGELADFALLLTPEDLPAVPFTLQPGVTVVNAGRFLTWLQADIRRGPSGPRARYGALQGDIRRLADIVFVPPSASQATRLPRESLLDC